MAVPPFKAHFSDLYYFNNIHRYSFFPEFCPLPQQAKPIIIKKTDLTVAGGIFLEPYIGDVGILFLLLLTFLYHQWDSFFRE